MKQNPSSTVLNWNTQRGWSMRGELSFARVPKLSRDTRFMLGEGAPDRIDLKAVERVDSAGLALLLHWALQARSEGRTLLLDNIPPQLRSLAHLYDIEELLLGRERDDGRPGSAPECGAGNTDGG